MARVRSIFHPILILLLLFSQVMTGWTFIPSAQAEGSSTEQTVTEATYSEAKYSYVSVIGNTGPLHAQSKEGFTEGEKALDVLKRAVGDNNVVTQTSSYGEMITSIKGLAAQKTYYWAFYVNGQQAFVGAGDYVVQSGDVLEFKYETWTTEASVKVVGSSSTDVLHPESSHQVQPGVDTALDLLVEAVGAENVVTEPSIYGPMLISIKGLASQDPYYWMFYVNGEQAQLGAGSYVVEYGDQLEFRYESWKAPSGGEDSTNPGSTPITQSEDPTNYDNSALTQVNQLIDQVSGTVFRETNFSEWDAISLATAGKTVPAHFKTELLASTNTFRQATDLSRRILAVRAVGLDPEDVNGVNYIAQLYQRDDAKTLVNNTIWSLIALNSGEYVVPSQAKFTKDVLVNALLAKQNADGGWSLTGSESDFDMTGMAITALSPFRHRAEVVDSIGKAVGWLSANQSANGGYYDDRYDPSPTISQVIIGIVSNGVSPSGSHFTNTEGSAIVNQLSFYHADTHKFFSEANSYRFATQQALMALAAYRNYIQGKGFIYQYLGAVSTDLGQVSPEKPVIPTGKKTITITVKGLDGDTLFATSDIEIEGEATPVTVLKKAIGASNVGVDSEGYVYSIMGLEEFDHGPTSGWTYSVNGDFPTTSAGYYQLGDGDDVKWIYTLKADPLYSTTNQIPNGIPKEVGEALQKLKEQISSESPTKAMVLNSSLRMSLEDAQKLKDQLNSSIVSLKKTVNVNEETTLTDPKGEVQLIVPKQALSTAKEFSIEELNGEKRAGAVSSIYEFLPHGSFAQSVYITIKVPLEEGNLDHLTLAWWDEQAKTWKPVPSVIDAQTGMVTALVDHFTQFAVVDWQKVQSKPVALNIDQPLEKAIAKVLQNQNPSEWEVFALARAGQSISKAYRDSIDQLIQDQQGNFRKVTDLERMALTIKAIGGDPTRTSGYNLIEKIYNHERLTMQGTNGVIFALLALDSGNYNTPAEAKWNREKLLSEILKNQNADGGFVLAEGEASNVDITSMALAALAPYQDRADVAAATKKALEWISKIQLANGGLELEGQENSESVAQTVIGLTSLGVDPRSSQFTKATGDLVTNLLRFQNEDGGFSNHFGQPSDPIATEQALMALIAYHNWVNGKGGLYQLVKVPQDRYDDESKIAAYALAAVYQAKRADVMRGVSVSPPLFAPKKKLTRAEFTSLLIRLKGEEPQPNAAPIFDDVKPGAWYYGFIAKAKEKGYISGVSATQFAPEKPITREEMAVMMAKAFGLQADDKPANFTDLSLAHASYLPYIEAVIDQGIMAGYQNRFDPKTHVTREMAATIAMKLNSK